MFRSRKFGFYAVILCLTGLLYMFLCAGLQAMGGRAADYDGQLPAAVGAFLAVPAAALSLALFPRRGIRQGLILWGGAAALGCLGLINAQSAYWLFFSSVVLIRCASAAIWACLVLLCGQWSIRCRGRMLGLVTVGMPLFFALEPTVTVFIQTRLGGDLRPFYLAAAAALALLALAVRALLRDRPEAAGLYPDGDSYAPEEETAPAPPLTLGRLLCQGRFWLLLAVTGAMAAAAAGCLGSVEARLLARGGGGPTLLGRAEPWLALGAVLAIPAGFLFGWLCDKLAVVWAALPLLAAEIGCACLLWSFPKEVDAAVGVPLCLTAACLLGGVPTALPALIARVYGRQQWLPACRVFLPALLLMAALTGPAAALLGGGERARLFVALIAVAALGLLFLPLLDRVLKKGRKSAEKQAQ